MSKVIITCVITVDGLIKAPVPAPDGWLIMEGDHEHSSLVDEVWFLVNPTIQGPGDRPFLDGPPIDLELLGSRSFDSGVTLLPSGSPDRCE